MVTITVVLMMDTQPAYKLTTKVATSPNAKTHEYYIGCSIPDQSNLSFTGWCNPDSMSLQRLL